MKRIYLIKLILFVIWACGPKNGNDNEDVGFDNSIGLSFIKLDSITIEFVGRPTVHDLDPISGIVVFMEHKEFSEDIFIADFDGNILSSFSKFGDMPDTYGKLMSNLKINGPNSFFVYGFRGFSSYDFNGNLLTFVKYDDFYVPSESRFAMGFGMEKISNKYLYINQEPRPTEVHQYKHHKLLTIVDPEIGKRSTVVGFPENSMFLNGSHFFSPSWFPVFTHTNNNIYIVLGFEPVIYVFDAFDPFKLKYSIPLDLPNYFFGKGTNNPNDTEFIGMMFTSGKIENIKLVDNFFILGYNPGYDGLDTKLFYENKTPEETKIFRERMSKKYPSRIVIIDSIGKVINDFIPDGLEPSSMLLRNGELWMMEKPDEEEERDYFKLFKVGLKVEN